MAIAILYHPPSYASVQDDLIYTTSETVKTADPVTYPNYKFIADVYVGGIMVARIRKVPNPANGIGVFNIGQVVRNYVAAVFNPAPNTLIAQQLGAGQFNVSVQVKFGEEYGFTSFYNVNDDEIRVFFNNYNGRENGMSSSIENVVDGIATNRPRIGEVFFSSAFSFLPFFAFSGMSPGLGIKPAGSGTDYVGAFSPTALGIAVLNVSPQAINSLSPGTITPATESYTLNVNGQFMTYRLICEAIYQPYTLHFLNQYGGFESKIFSKVSHNSIKIDRKDFGKLPYQIGSDGIPFKKNANGVFNESRSNYSVQFTESMVLNTDNLNDEEYVWLKELVVSPMVYLEDGGNFYPVVITDNDYEDKKVINEEVSNLTLNIQFGNQLNAQYS